ncbi:MAG: hypothetical protein LBV43_00410 [Prevotella sp.]|jgi:hypothetical protein|nr:hypothetical protein [Prevotella sp.]
MKINKQIIFYLLFVLLIANFRLEAQVTIGSNIDSNKGSLLDLKEKAPESNNSNATRGLLLPRVRLTDKDDLFPMFETSPGSGAANENYTGSLKDEQDSNHTGLFVYNLNRCNGFGKGTYVWNGITWDALRDVRYLDVPQILSSNQNAELLDANTILIRVPSGTDLRPFTYDEKLSIGWIPSNLSVSKDNNIENTIGTGLTFNSNNPATWANPSINPTIYPLDITTMSDVVYLDCNPDWCNPFISRETTVKFQTTADECGRSNNVTIRLNQTNYRLVIKKTNYYLQQWGTRLRRGGRYGSGTFTYRFLITPLKPDGGWDGDFNDLEEQSNAVWKMAYEEKEPNIFSSTGGIPQMGGQEIIDGATPPIHYYKPERNLNPPDSRYKMAGTFTFSDTARIQRFYPVEVSYVQCATGFDKSGIVNGDGLDPALWGDQVLSHTDQDGNVFYSAGYGTAGRWMITNLAAKTYAENSPAYNAGKTLIAFDDKPVENHDNGKGKYAYQVMGDKLTWVEVD